MVTGQTTTAATETGIEEEAVIEETTGEDTNRGIIMAMMEVDIEEVADMEEATLAVAEGAAEDIEETELVISNSIINVLKEVIILKETKP